MSHTQNCEVLAIELLIRYFHDQCDMCYRALGLKSVMNDTTCTYTLTHSPSGQSHAEHRRVNTLECVAAMARPIAEASVRFMSIGRSSLFSDGLDRAATSATVYVLQCTIDR